MVEQQLQSWFGKAGALPNTPSNIRDDLTSEYFTFKPSKKKNLKSLAGVNLKRAKRV